MISIEEYSKSKPLPLPFESTRLGFTLHLVRGYCCNCGKETSDIRGTIREYETCVEARYAGSCFDCKGITNHIMRWYPKDGKIMFVGKNGWQTVDPPKPGLLDFILGKIYKLIFRG